MSKKIIVNSIFNSLKGYKKGLKKEWIDYRIKIFMNFTLKSLKKQTNQNFLALVQYAPETKDLIKNALSKYNKLPKNVRFVTPDEYDKEVIKNIGGHKYLYEVRLDCDDMYHKTFIEQLHNHTPKKNTQVLMCQNGYLYDSVNNRLARFPYKSSNYYANIYRVKDYLKGQRYKRTPHGHILDKFICETTNKPNYIRHAHLKNNLTTFERYNFKKSAIINGNNKIKKILKEFF
ncbi:glycosyltransferase [Dethiothermospora halolimnae]|uniref:glycosyltransferase n=1 Tax=Dethiothermospora halolimnae TaxID=3114390 RepID=UPI003CCC41DC